MIQLKNITKIYKSKTGKTTKALNDISLNIRTGMTFVVGKSGCGKSTLLNLIGGLDRYDQGEIIVSDVSTKDFSAVDFDHYRNKYIGFVFQEYHLLDEETVEENISVALKMRSGDIDIAKINGILKRVGLEGFNNRRIDELSGGEKQRVAIARALIKSPQIILADEPTGALDSENGKSILQLLKEISKEKPVIVVSHDKEYAKTYGDRIIELADGRVISDTNKDTQPPEAAADLKECREKFIKESMHLPFKDAFKFGVKGLKKRKLRMITAIVLASVSLFMFGICSAFFVYNRSKVILNSMYDSDIHFAQIKKDIVFYNDYSISCIDAAFGDNDLLFFSQKFKKNTVVPIVGFSGSYSAGMFYDCYFADYLADLGEPNYVFDTTAAEICGGMEIDAGLADKFNFKLLAGNYPTADNHVVITEFQYMFFQRFGHLDPTSGVKSKIDSYNDLLGKNFGFTGGFYRSPYDFEIAGIMDTNLNKRRYTKIWQQEFPPEGVEQEPYHEIETMHEELMTGGHQLIFLNLGSYSKRHDMHKDLYNRKDTIEVSSHLCDPVGATVLTNHGPTIYDLKTKLGGSFPYRAKSRESVPVINGFPFDIYWKDSIERTILTDKQVVLSMEQVRLLPSLKEKYAGLPTDEQILEAFNNGEITGLRYEFRQDDKYELDIELVGIYTLEDSEDYIYYDTVFVSDSYYEDIKEHFGLHDYRRIAVALTGKFKDDSKFMDYITSQRRNTVQNTGYIFDNFFYNQVIASEERLLALGLVLLAVGIVMAIFAGLMIFNYFNTAISDKKKEIGILRAMGARKRDIYTIFLSRGVIIALINTIIAIVLTAIGIALCNYILDTMFGVYITVVSFGILPILFITSLSAITMLLSSVFPIKRIASLPPIEAIKGL